MIHSDDTEQASDTMPVSAKRVKHSRNKDSLFGPTVVEAAIPIHSREDGDHGFYTLQYYLHIAINLDSSQHPHTLRFLRHPDNYRRSL